MKDGNLSQEDIEALFSEVGKSLEEVDEELDSMAGEGEGDGARQKSAEGQSKDVPSKPKPDTFEKPKVEPTINRADFKEFSMEPSQEQPISDMGVLLDIPLSISVELGKSKCYVKDLLSLTVGSIVEALDRLAGDPVDILVNGKIFAKGEVVVIDENFGVRIQEVLSKEKNRKSITF